MEDRTYLSIQAPPFPYFLECGKEMYAPGGQHPNRYRLGVFDLLFVIKGTLFIGEENQQWSLSAGQLLLLLPDRYHYSVKPCETETVFYWLHFQIPGKWEEVHPPNMDVKGDSALKHRLPTQIDGAAYAINVPQYWLTPDIRELSHLMDKLLELSVESRFLSFWEEHRIFGEILKRMDEGRRAENATAAELVAEKAEAYIKQNYHKGLSNESLSEALHFHSNYITRCMKEFYRCTPMEYLHKYRLEQAKLLLLKTDWPIGKIAEHVGFSSSAYFSSCFVKEVGSPPLRFRKSYSK